MWAGDRCAHPGVRRVSLEKALHMCTFNMCSTRAAFLSYLELEHLNDVFWLKLKCPQEHLFFGRAFHAL